MEHGDASDQSSDLTDPATTSPTSPTTSEPSTSPTAQPTAQPTSSTSQNTKSEKPVVQLKHLIAWIYKKKFSRGEDQENNMAARRPPRNGKEDRDDAHEERNMWDQILRDLEKCKAINNRAKEVSRLIIEKEEKMAKREYCLLICEVLDIFYIILEI